MYNASVNKEIIDNLPMIGTVIKTRHPDYFDWSTTIVKNIAYQSGTTTELSFVDEYYSKIVMIDDTLSCKGADKETVYAFNGIVSKIDLSSTESIFLDIYEASKMKNIRSFNRYDISCIATSDDDSIYAVAINISKSGLSIYTKTKLEKGQFVELDIYFTKYNKINAKFEVMWINNKIGNFYIYGLRLEKIDDIYRENLDNNIQFLASREGKVALWNLENR
jgi:hypothetical protein